MIYLEKTAEGICLERVPARREVTYARPMSELEDSALMLRYAEESDTKAFEELYRRHKDPLYRYLLRHLINPDAAQDVFQDVWGKIIKSRDRYRPQAKFSTYLYRVAHNAFIDYCRRNKRYSGGEDRTAELASVSPGPDQDTEIALARQKLLAALATLPEEQRDAYLLREEGGLSVDEIAGVMGVGREAAKSRLRYATSKLKQALEIS